MTRLFFATLLLVVVCCFSVNVARSQTVRTIALSDQHAPGTTGNIRFNGFGPPHLNSAGQAAFVASLAGEGLCCNPYVLPTGIFNNSGIWMGDGGSLSLVVRAGEQAPGLPAGVRYRGFYDTILPISSNGPLAFEAGASAPGGANYFGVWAGNPGGFNLVLKAGDHAPDTAPELYFSNFDGPGHFKMNSAGQGLLDSELGALDYYTDDNGLWSSKSGTLALVARTGDHAPGMPADVYFEGLGRASLNSSGSVAFAAGLSGGGFGYLFDQSIWSDRSGSVALIASAGRHAAGTDASVVFRGLSDYPLIDTAGHVAFDGWLSGPGVIAANDNGIWSDVSGSLSLVVRAGDRAPGTRSDVTFQEIDDPDIFFSNSGKIAFVASLAGPGVDPTNNFGIWSNTSGAFRPVMRAGDAAPGISGKVFGGSNSIVFNDAGQVAFRGLVTDPGVAINNPYEAIHGLWAEDKAGELHLIVREGGQIEVAPGDFRTVESFDYVSGDIDGLNGDGSPYAFNARGEFAFFARFTDGTYGNFVSDVATIPVPSSLALLSSAVIALFASQRRYRSRPSRQLGPL
jgi:hypothetical protein